MADAYLTQETKDYTKNLTDQDNGPDAPHCLVSFLSPKRGKVEYSNMCIRGIARSAREAEEKAKMLHELNGNFDIFTVELGKFYPIYLDGEQREYINKADIKHANALLNAMIEDHKKIEESREALFTNRISNDKRKALQAEHVKKADVSAESLLMEIENLRSEIYGMEEHLQAKFSEDELRDARRTVDQWLSGSSSHDGPDGGAVVDEREDSGVEDLDDGPLTATYEEDVVRTSAE